jgi:hypothetical protein
MIKCTIKKKGKKNAIIMLAKANYVSVINEIFKRPNVKKV